MTGVVPSSAHIDTHRAIPLIALVAIAQEGPICVDTLCLQITVVGAKIAFVHIKTAVSIAVAPRWAVASEVRFGTYADWHLLWTVIQLKDASTSRLAEGSVSGIVPLSALTLKWSLGVGTVSILITIIRWNLVGALVDVVTVHPIPISIPVARFARIARAYERTKRVGANAHICRAIVNLKSTLVHISAVDPIPLEPVYAFTREA
jgi:hypothetical protein